MLALVRLPLLAFALVSLGFVVAQLGGLAQSPACAQTARPGGQESAGPESRQPARAALQAVPPELKLLMEQIKKSVEAVEKKVDRAADELRATAIRYGLWAAAGFFALMLVSSMLGGTVVALLFRRSGRA